MNTSGFLLALVGTILIGIATTTLTLNIVIIIRSERNYRRLNDLPAYAHQTPDSPPGSVDIIIPARNEGAIIKRVVSSLQALDYSNYQIIVVNDDSIDNTAHIARSMGAQVLQISGILPQGWTGKCNACHYAAQRSKADWLLFTDADTCHRPESLAQVIDYAEQHNFDAVSLLLRQECGSFWERIVLPLAYQNFFSALHPEKPAFNGQYIMIRRRVYEESGGFGAVRGRVMEDVALADVLSHKGYKIQLINGHNAASVRMYQTLPALLRGMTKTAFTAARDRGIEGFMLALPFFFGSLTLPSLLYGIVTAHLFLTVIVLANILVIGLGLHNWLHRFDINPGWPYMLTSQVGVLILFWVGFVSTIRTITGRGVRWKGRIIVEKRTMS